MLIPYLDLRTINLVYQEQSLQATRNPPNYRAVPSLPMSPHLISESITAICTHIQRFYTDIAET